MIGTVIERLKAGLPVGHFSARIVVEAKRQLEATASTTVSRRQDRNELKSKRNKATAQKPKRVYDFSHLAALSAENTQREIEAEWAEAFAAVAAERSQSTDPMAIAWDAALIKAAGPPADHRLRRSNPKSSSSGVKRQLVKTGRRGDMP